MAVVKIKNMSYPSTFATCTITYYYIWQQQQRKTTLIQKRSMRFYPERKALKVSLILLFVDIQKCVFENAVHYRLIARYYSRNG